MSKLEEIETLMTHRKVAQIVLEATTPLKVGSGDSHASIDAPVLKNWNALPMIQGTSLAGVLRVAFKDAGTKEHLFGKEFGSRVLVSHAHLLDKNGQIIYKLGRDDDPDFLNHYDDLPVREHTAITDKGAALKGSKFDEEVVYKGSRFKFELELITTNDVADNVLWDALLSKFSSPLFRLGGGSTKGFGEMAVRACHVKEYALGVDYHEKPSNLNTLAGTITDVKPSDKALTYYIALEPADFFSFGSGFGDDEVDDIAVTEQKVDWEEGIGKFYEEKILMPASSLKGALSHRVAFHYNKIKGDYIETIDNPKDYVGSNNVAVATLFGAAKGHTNESKGKALFSDMFKTFDKNNTKIFDHVKIDRFTGGAMDSALYSEKVIAQRDVWQVKIVLSEDIEVNVKIAFENTLDDLAKGWLPLGGMVNRGHGVFISPDYVEGDATQRGWSCTDKGGKIC
jgi:CRISPR/Cas system CMR subunit Cmr4 (Cas7 group RAMP superfamily)